ncbi:MAG: type II toxin-antitoxin system PemK/MazF family toxin [Sphingomonadaceae bacterium]
MTPGDVVWVDFPYVESNRRRSRPAVVIATDIGGPFDLFWASMITGSERAAWPDDVVIEDYQAIGLPIPSAVRTAKMSTFLEATAVPLGRLDEATWRCVIERFIDIAGRRRAE